METKKRLEVMEWEFYDEDNTQKQISICGGTIMVCQEGGKQFLGTEWALSTTAMRQLYSALGLALGIHNPKPFDPMDNVQPRVQGVSLDS